MHRDIKRANILMHLTDDGYIIYKICDFGLARELDGDSLTTRLGTPIYRAPEVMSDNGYTMSADMWSFGLVIYECLFNGQRRLFQGDNNAIAFFVQTHPIPMYVAILTFVWFFPFPVVNIPREY
jgi:serine/threonine protein kinase